jgi:hypothetical protein
MRRKGVKKKSMKVVKSGVSKRQQSSINKIKDPKQKAFVKRRMLMGDSITKAKKAYASKKKLS